MKMEIRVATQEDAKDLLNIYAYYVEHTAITFEHEVPTLEEFTCRIKDTLKNYPYLVALVDGKIAGYIYAGAADPVEEDEYLTRNSEHFHEAIGYKVVARYHECGSKFGRWYNLLEMEKIIGNRVCPPKEFIPFCELRMSNAVML